MPKTTASSQPHVITPPDIPPTADDSLLPDEPDMPVAEASSEDTHDNNEPLVEKRVRGYKLEQLLSAAVKPPVPETTEDQELTHNSKVKFLIAVGAALGVIGLLLLLMAVNPLLCLLLMLLGAAAVTVSVFAPVQ